MSNDLPANADPVTIQARQLAQMRCLLRGLTRALDATRFTEPARAARAQDDVDQIRGWLSRLPDVSQAYLDVSDWAGSFACHIQYGTIDYHQLEHPPR